MEQIEPVADLVLNVSLVKDTVLLGEPIMLDCKITTSNGGDIWFYLGREHDKWMTLELFDDAKQLVSARIDPRTPQGGMYTNSGSAAVGRPYHGLLAVTRALEVSHAGRYELHTTAKLPHLPMPLAMQVRRNGVVAKPWYETIETVLVQEQSFVISVLEPDEIRLREIAEAFRQAAVMESDFDQRITAVQALVSMPEQYALASWQALAKDARFRHRETLMNELARAMTPSAADVLAFLWVAGPGSLVLSNLSTVLLDNMYRAGDSALKQHIKEIFSRRGKAISDHPLMFIGA